LLARDRHFGSLAMSLQFRHGPASASPSWHHVRDRHVMQAQQNPRQPVQRAFMGAKAATVAFFVAAGASFARRIRRVSASTNLWASRHEGAGGRPLLIPIVEGFFRFLARVLLAAEAGSIQVRIDAESSAALALGRLRSFKLHFGRLHRGLQAQRARLEAEALDVGYKPMFTVVAMLFLFIRPSLVLPLIVLVLAFMPGHFSESQVRNRATFSLHLEADDMDRSKLWRFMLTAALRDIMEYSLAGLVALPREINGELSTATCFELEAINIDDSRLVMDAVAQLPDGTLFKYRLRTGATLKATGPDTCIFWEDPEIQVSAGWPFPDFWAPIGGFAGRRIGGALQMTSISFPSSGGMTVEGRIGGSEVAMVAL